MGQKVPGEKPLSFQEYTGISSSWLQKRPKLPSRNWLIFLSTTAAILGLYAYDRKQCKQIHEHYVEKVKHLAEAPLSSSDFARKVIVYGSKWPGDEDSQRAMKYFRKYVKPILVAAAVDYDMINGRHHGDLADLVAEKIKIGRRIDLGLEPPPFQPPLPIPGLRAEEARRRESEGGIIIVGRHTFKEFMHGLKRGWTEPPYVVDKQELLAHELANDGVFDETITQDEGEPTLQPSSTLLPPKNSALGSHFGMPPLSSQPPRTSVQSKTATEDPKLLVPPSNIPNLPPLLLLPFTNLIGFTLIPRMIWDFFNRRHDVRNGAEAAYTLITTSPRPLRGPLSAREDGLDEVETSPGSDLSFDLEAEKYYKLGSVPDEIEKARKSYYEALRPKIATARELARGTRAPTKDEQNHPPPTEVELRAERMKKELRWRSNLVGSHIIDPATPVAWDPRFAGALSIYSTFKRQND
ncbi:inner membrane protein import complex subunit Tim54-domain-containing protein [Hysterangium stoloniferum]|nr:inner membrane protein import complex subunit Tim54-domain-containing protein [Hysterangium stoloniferum]